MRGALWAGAAAVALALCYLLLWPVPIEPIAWDAPVNRGFVDPFGSNNQLQRLRSLNIGPRSGPEDVTAGHDGQLYATSHDGTVLRIDRQGGVTVFAKTGGRPLGIETDADGSMVVANAYLGLQRISLDGTVATLLDEINGKRLVYADDLAIADDGTRYLSEASTKFGAEQYGGTYAASLLDITEHGGHGLIIEFNPASGATRVLLDGLNFANGVAISDDQSFLLIAETGAYRILKYWLAGPRAGQSDILIDNLPAFPDNINTGLDGRFWIGFAAPRSEPLDKLSGSPFLRRVVQRLPARFHPRALPHSQVIAINADGEVLMNLQDRRARYPTMTGVLETQDTLYLTTLFGQQLPYIRKDDL